MDERSSSVYLIDDDVDVLESGNALLTACGYSVACFADPTEFMQKVDPTQIGCVVTDLKMPGLTGVELIEKLQAIKGTLAVILVSAYADIPITVRAMQNGAVSVVEKPYELRYFREAVERALTCSQRRFESSSNRRSARYRLSSLDSDEREIMGFLAKGHPSKTVADLLEISMRTVARKRQSAFRKSLVSSIEEFIRLELSAND